MEKVIEGLDKVVDSPMQHLIGIHFEDNEKRNIHLIFYLCSIDSFRCLLFEHLLIYAAIDQVSR